MRRRVGFFQKTDLKSAKECPCQNFVDKNKRTDSHVLIHASKLLTTKRFKNLLLKGGRYRLHDNSDEILKGVESAVDDFISLHYDHSKFTNLAMFLKTTLRGYISNMPPLQNNNELQRYKKRLLKSKNTWIFSRLTRQHTT